MEGEREAAIRKCLDFRAAMKEFWIRQGVRCSPQLAERSTIGFSYSSIISGTEGREGENGGKRRKEGQTLIKHP